MQYIFHVNPVWYTKECDKYMHSLLKGVGGSKLSTVIP